MPTSCTLAPISEHNYCWDAPIRVTSMASSHKTLMPNLPALNIQTPNKAISRTYQSTVGMLLRFEGLNDVQPVRKPKPKPKDHTRENVRRLRQMQSMSKKREAEANKPVKALWKSEKYNNVSSKVVENLQAPPPPSRPETGNYLRAHSKTGPPPDLVSRAKSASPARNKETSNNEAVNFIKLNGIAVKNPKLFRSNSTTSIDELKNKPELNIHGLGTIPKYLIQRKVQWHKEEEQRRLMTPDSSIPPGHSLMPDEERRETLELLKKNEQEVIKEIQSLPVRSDTRRLIDHKKDLERKMFEIEDAIKIFSRSKVFVKNDE